MARILDFYAVRWEYEPHTFPILWNLEGAVVESFAPDFYLPELDLYLEMTTLKQRLGALIALCVSQRCTKRSYPALGAFSLPYRRRRRVGREPLIKAAVTCAIVGHSTRCIELDRFERPHERPAQAETIAHCLVEIVRRHDTVGH